jgi:hypothetical protein
MGPVGVAAMGDGDDVDAVATLVDGVDRAVLAPSGAPQAVQRCVELLAEAVRVLGNGAGQVFEQGVAAGSGSRFMPRRLAAVKTTV